MNEIENSKPKAEGKKKLRQSARKSLSVSGRTRWAYCMQGAEAQEIDQGALNWLTAVFGDHHPQWLIASRPWREVTGEQFKAVRGILSMTRKQCAVYLHLAPKTIERWETGKQRILFPAFEALRLLSETVHARLSHRQWDGWFFSRATGEFVSPDVGRLAVTPHELNRLPQLYADLAEARREIERQKIRADELQAENTRLRELFLSQGVTDELHSMHGRLSALLSQLNTARVYNLPAVTERDIKEAIA
ncbi:MAG: hypothetical protein M9884_03105 [Rhodocyclaceae bacterium]|nr:hypothetical protein [Rhodocyclaceae bacterium]